MMKSRTNWKQCRRIAGAALVVAAIALPHHALANSTPWAPTDSYRAMLGLMVALSSQQMAASNHEPRAQADRGDAAKDHKN